MGIKNIIREIIKESLFYKRGNIPDMAGRITKSGLKKNDYIDSGEVRIRKEFLKLVIQFIKANYPNELERYKGKFMYKLNKSMFYLSEDDVINYDSIFLKAVNNKDEKSIELANQFLNDVETDNIRKSRKFGNKDINFKPKKKIDIKGQIEKDNLYKAKMDANKPKEEYKQLKNRIILANNLLNNNSLLRRDNHLQVKFIDIAIKMGLIDDDYMGKLYMASGERATSLFKNLINEKLIELKNEMQMMINKYGEENLV